MRWHGLFWFRARPGHSFGVCGRTHSCVQSRSVQSIQTLPSWELQSFRELVLTPAQPAHFARQHLPPACQKWFIHDNHVDFDLSQAPQSSELRSEFWSEHESTIVPLELTSKDGEAEFRRVDAPLKLLLSFLRTVPSPSSKPLPAYSIYLAQCDLDSLPPSLQADVPIPEIVSSGGRGDIYSSSLWLGRPPTCTPLHRDPNPNFFLQLAGRKLVRLLPPAAGEILFEDVQERIGTAGSAAFRGEEMMQGIEKDLLDQAIWNQDERFDKYSQFLLESHLGIGEALFIPKGWWHSVKGVGDGITASVNWWFR